jgi:hypothetical protein
MTGVEPLREGSADRGINCRTVGKYFDAFETRVKVCMGCRVKSQLFGSEVGRLSNASWVVPVDRLVFNVYPGDPLHWGASDIIRNYGWVSGYPIDHLPFFFY